MRDSLTLRVAFDRPLQSIAVGSTFSLKARTSTGRARYSVRIRDRTRRTDASRTTRRALCDSVRGSQAAIADSARRADPLAGRPRPPTHRTASGAPRHHDAATIAEAARARIRSRAI